MANDRPGMVKSYLNINLDQETLEKWLRHNSLLSKEHGHSISHSADPVREAMIQRTLPKRHLFRELLSDRSRIKSVATRKWVQWLIDYGVEETMSFPVHTGFGEYWSFGLIRFNDLPDLPDLTPEFLCEFQWIALNLVEFCATKMNWRVPGEQALNKTLAPREIDCLYWAAKGKTSVETAEIMKIGVETVRKYLKNALTKLEAKTKTQAVSLAHRNGILPFNLDHGVRTTQ